MSIPGNTDRFETLVAIIARLRAPDGCPWDREQTHHSLRGNLLSECYETLQALDEGGPEKLCEELGDLLLQIVLHARIAADSGEFTIDDIIRGISEKLIRRHPHIFGSVSVRNAEEVAQNWEALKREEREAGVSMLASVPASLPALSYSLEVQRRAARAGFDWEDDAGVIEKLAEEIEEYRTAEGPEAREQEFGDLLFTLVNIARRRGIDAETALRRTNRRFFDRFTYMEGRCHERERSFAELSFDEQNELWEEAKRATQL